MRFSQGDEAVVLGEPLPVPDEQGWSRIKLPMRIDYANRPRSIIDYAHGKPSLTHWKTLGPGPWPDTTRHLHRPQLPPLHP